MTNCDYHQCLPVCHNDNTIKICNQPCNLLYEYTCFNLMLFSCCLSVNFIQLSNTFRIFFFFFGFCSFIRRFAIRSSAIDRWKGIGIHWTGLPKSNHTRRFSTVSSVQMVRLDWIWLWLFNFIWIEIMAGPKRKCYKSCYHSKVVGSSKPWNSIHLLVFIMKIRKLRWEIFSARLANETLY